jgi:hypothetical protein
LLIVTTLHGVYPYSEKVASTKVDPLVCVTIEGFVTTGLFILTLAGKGKALMEVDGRVFFGARA